MELIETTEEHIPFIRAIADEVWPETFAGILSAEQIAYMMEMMYSTDAIKKQMNELRHRYLLAKSGSDHLGYLSYETDYKGKPWTKVHKIYVLPGMQGKGTGRFLMEAAARIARENGNTELSLNVNRHNKALYFYQHIGFEIIGREDIDIGNGFLMEDFILNKKLDGRNID